ncbi:hypothetical protein FNV43_RR09849 [Rhamnella rubrinervis]|uniref:DUF4283 domain-containing protein n=1 Tax=Rhamnella rubrinervis TaxID=2594499 RepID=A0A8K0HBH7_9ROSA|nr:hypothetical protein FNV43_RR09849 [Rhamnella rubrinervis]
MYGDVAQVVECSLSMREARGSISRISTSKTKERHFRVPEWLSGMNRNHVDSARAEKPELLSSYSKVVCQNAGNRARRLRFVRKWGSFVIASMQIVVDRPSLQISWSLFRSSSIVCKNRLVREVTEGELRLRGCRGFEVRSSLDRAAWVATLRIAWTPRDPLTCKLVDLGCCRQLISLGRGYFQVLLFSTEDRQKVWSDGSLNLKLGIVRLQVWVKNFNSATQKLTNAQIWVRFYNLNWEFWHPHILTDLARGIAGFILEKLLLETKDHCIEVELYFESFPNFCTSCHSVGHSVAKYKSVIGKMPLKDGSHVNKKENKAPVLNQVYKARQVPLQPIKSTTPSMPTTNAFDVLNTEVTPAHIEDMVHQHDATLSGMTNKMGIEVRSSAPDLGAATTRTDINIEMGKSIRTTSKGNEPEDDDYADDFGEDEWTSLQGEGSSKPSNEFDDTPYTGQQSNTMVMVPIESSGALTTEQGNLDLVASQPNFSETTDQNLWNMVKKKPGRPRKVQTLTGTQINEQTFLSAFDTTDLNLWSTVKRKPGRPRKLQIATSNL